MSHGVLIDRHKNASSKYGREINLKNTLMWKYINDVLKVLIH